jgi:hypothetical protein
MTKRWIKCLVCICVLLCNITGTFPLSASPLDFFKKKKEKKKDKSEFKYNLSLCAIFRNEAPYLKEWIEFHRLVGVEHFYLYNNLSTDNYQEVLAYYVKKGIVDLVDVPQEHGNIGEWATIQCSTYDKAIKKARHKTKWMAVLDTDEFLFPVQHDSLVEFLKEYETYPAVCVNWQMYGTSHVDIIPRGRLLTETLTWKAPTEFGDNYHVKTILKPKCVKATLSPHHFEFEHKALPVNTSKITFSGPLTPQVLVDKARINHYWTRDEFFLYNTKIKRRESFNEKDQGVLNRAQQLNAVEDRAIFRFIPKLKKRM